MNRPYGIADCGLRKKDEQLVVLACSTYRVNGQAVGK